MSKSPGSWYAVHTRSNFEKRITGELDRKGIETFLPVFREMHRWKDRKKKIDWPLFPGYCFARFQSDGRLPVLKCSGVVSIVSFDGEIVPIPEHEIEGIRRLVESDLQFDPCPLIREGMMVESVRGSSLVPHPLLAVERQAHRAFVEHMKLLKLKF